MRSKLIIGLVFAAMWHSAHSSTLAVLECKGVRGERVFVDRDRCPPESQAIATRVLKSEPPIAYPVAPPPIAAPSKRPRVRSSYRSARALPVSFRCSTHERTWYQHAPCRSDARQAQGNKNRGGKNEAGVRQTRVARAFACREIARPAAALRRGSERDERAGPYAKAQGRDPCR